MLISGTVEFVSFPVGGAGGKIRRAGLNQSQKYSVEKQVAVFDTSWTAA